MATEIVAEGFDPFRIMDSGQCFRMIRISDRAVETVAFGRRIAVTALGNGRFSFGCDPAEYARLWKPYFALDTDYGVLLAAAPKGDAYLARALVYASGLRILRQDPWETLCAFILSQRKHILAIRACVEALCDRYGEPVEGTPRRAFPTAERLAAHAESDLRPCASGYRAPYLLAAARRAAAGALDFAALGCLPDEALHSALCAEHGVGPKVADCAMLFGFGRLARAPVDVWVRRVIDEEYGGNSPFPAYGAYAGFYQQALFVFRRDAGRGPEAEKRRRAPPAGRAAR
jgi:N-glycosylase/DNA lyase